MALIAYGPEVILTRGYRRLVAFNDRPISLGFRRQFVADVFFFGSARRGPRKTDPVCDNDDLFTHVAVACGLLTR